MAPTRLKKHLLSRNSRSGQRSYRRQTVDEVRTTIMEHQLLLPLTNPIQLLIGPDQQIISNGRWSRHQPTIGERLLANLF